MLSIRYHDDADAGRIKRLSINILTSILWLSVTCANSRTMSETYLWFLARQRVLWIEIDIAWSSADEQWPSEDYIVHNEMRLVYRNTSVIGSNIATLDCVCLSLNLATEVIIDSGCQILCDRKSAISTSRDINTCECLSMLPSFGQQSIQCKLCVMWWHFYFAVCKCAVSHEQGLHRWYVRITVWPDSRFCYAMS